MKIIPFRIKPSEIEDDYSDVYEFLIKGSDKDAYIIEIFIDSLNDLGITETKCTCADYFYRQNICKHIKMCQNILKEFNVETGSEEKLL